MSDRHVNATRIWYTRNATDAIAAHLGLQLDDDGKPTETGVPGTSRDRSAHDAAGGVDAGLRAALVELADRWEDDLSELRLQGPPRSTEPDSWGAGWDAALDAVEALLVAHPVPGTGPWPESVDVRPGQWVVRHPDGAFTVQDDAPAPAPDVRREGVAKEVMSMAALTVPPDGVKMLRETLARAQAALARRPMSTSVRTDINRLGDLIRQCDAHRPFGPDGKLDDRHTTTCGCECRGLQTT
ncbi:hypothetical protein [Oerskovia enterophila]|uniref:Uncharacterized protein n=1 Tax=Oerskovia enterophila TaxID=43678 RepID=A0A163QU13_9CELL|nr:hypothetical protein [Oerskovia enterophila]KZM34530.1 hypothetical protein OJAG_28290 [Oerskovia enterophila]